MTKDTYQGAQAKFAVALLVGALIVMALPIMNGGPAVYHDTPAYLKHAAKFAELLFSRDSQAETVTPLSEHQARAATSESHNVITSGRSLYYGLFLYIGWATTFWVPIAIQAIVISWLVLNLFKLASPRAWQYKAIAALVLISLFSSASFFTGLLMPDIWAGIMILTLAVLWTCSHQLSKWSKLAMLAILAFAVLAHSSHFLLLAAIMLLFIVLWALKPDQDESLARKMAIPAIALVCGVVGMMSWALAVTLGHGAKLLHRPFLTAHLTDLGPGTNYLKQSCPESGFVLCDYKDKLPIAWHYFLFDQSPETGVFGAAPEDVQLAISDEQTAFVLHTLAAEPGSTVFGLLKDGLKQLWTLSMAGVAITQKHEAYLLDNAPMGLVEQLKETLAYTNPDLTRPLERSNEILAVLSVLVLGAWLILRSSRNTLAAPQTTEIDKVVTILIAGVVLNALICGILASPYGRFQARIIWLLPLIASFILASQTIAFKKPRRLLKLDI